MRRILTLCTAAALAMTLSLTLGACGDEPVDLSEGSLLETKHMALLAWETDPGMVQPASCEDAERLFEDMAATNMLASLEQQRRWDIEWFIGGGWGWDAAPMAAGGGEQNGALADDGASAGASEGGGGNAYTDTNNQVAGVDEADLVKTDGEYIYALMGGDLVVVDAWPASEASEVGRVAIAGWPMSIHRSGDTLVVLSSAQAEQVGIETPQGDSGGEYDYYYYGWQPVTVVTRVDASDPTRPKIVASHAFDGSNLSTRRIGERIYLVQTQWFELPGVQYWVDTWQAGSVAEINRRYAEVATSNLAAIADLEIEDVLPRRWDLGTHGDQVVAGSEQQLTGCEDLRVPRGYAGQSLLTVATIDLGAPADALPAASSIVGEWGNVYASTNALYVAVTNWGWSWFLDSSSDLRTRVHRFEFGDTDGSAVFTGSGEVPGYALNQFSLDEHNGNLRIATTVPDWWWMGSGDDSESYVSVMSPQEDGRLITVGQVGGLGEGEQIYSVRFVGDTGYVVTFRQVDPLYVVDLRNPQTPAVTGELKIPGYSSYMHPIGDGLLLTIGRDADENGSDLGLSFQIFDVNDPTDPQQVAKTVLGDAWNAWSEALYDHHAFTWYPEKQLLAVPVSTWSESANGYWGYDSELTLFRVDVESGVTPVGAIDHERLLTEYDDVEGCWEWWTMNAEIRRGVFIEDFIYSVSSIGIRVHDVEALAEGALADLPLLEADSTADYCYGGYYW